MSIRSRIEADKERRRGNLQSDVRRGFFRLETNREEQSVEGPFRVRRTFDFVADRAGAVATAHVQPPFPAEGYAFSGGNIERRYISPDYLSASTVTSFFGDVRREHEALVADLAAAPEAV